MSLNWKEIANGLRNHFIPAKEKRELINQVHDSRMEICNQCPNNSTNAKKTGYQTVRPDEHCTICKCNLTFKTKSLSTECPDSPARWEMILPDQERLKVEKEIRDEEQNQNN